MAEHANVYPLRREPQRDQPQREREPQPEPRPRERQAQEPLWREVLGRRLRGLRQEQQETLSETAARAGISPQYLSEIERGRKEPSSEMIAALAGALGTTLIDLTEHVAGDLRRQMSLAPRASRTRASHARPGRARPGDILALAA
jgi:transcriptional regulator with XRE-family HTH domain